MKYLVAHILEWLSYLILFASLAFWSRRDKRGVIKVLSGYYFICAIFILKASEYVGTSGSNIYIYSILCVLSSFCLGAYFYTVLLSFWAKALIIFSCLLNGGYYLFTNIFQNGRIVFDSTAYVLLAISIVVLCFVFIVQLMNNVKEDPLSMNFDFWFVAAQLIYFIGAFVIFVSFGYLTMKVLENPGNKRIYTPLTWLWGLHNVLLFLSSLLITGGIIWISSRRKLRG